MTGPEGRPLRAGASVNDIMGGMFGAIGALLADGSAPMGGTPEQSAQFLKAEHARWGAIVRDAGIKPD